MSGQYMKENLIIQPVADRCQPRPRETIWTGFEEWAYATIVLQCANRGRTPRATARVALGLYPPLHTTNCLAWRVRVGMGSDRVFMFRNFGNQLWFSGVVGHFFTEHRKPNRIVGFRFSVGFHVHKLWQSASVFTSDRTEQQKKSSDCFGSPCYKGNSISAHSNVSAQRQKPTSEASALRLSLPFLSRLLPVCH
jgi:hypothetical protein